MRKSCREDLNTRPHSFFEWEKKADKSNVFLLQKFIVDGNISIEKKKFLRDGIFIENNKIPYIEKIPIFIQISQTYRDFHEKKKFTMNATIILKQIIDTSNM